MKTENSTITSLHNNIDCLDCKQKDQRIAELEKENEQLRANQNKVSEAHLKYLGRGIDKNYIKESHFEYLGRDCIVIFNRMGFRCGYVSVSAKDKDFKFEGCDNVDCCAFNISCHGGLTFGGKLNSDIKPKQEYYIGFDCGHFGDGFDITKANEYGFNTMIMSYINFGEYVTLEECINECKYIAEQLLDNELLKKENAELESEKQKAVKEFADETLETLNKYSIKGTIKICDNVLKNNIYLLLKENGIE